MKYFALAVLFLLTITGTVDAQTSPAGITITNAWSRATPSANATGVVYFNASDNGADDTLTGASTPIAAKAQLHESKMNDGIMQMRAVDGLPIDKDHPITLAPGGYHLMLTGLTKQLKAGDTFPLTLTFAHTGQVSAMVRVEGAGAKGSEMPEMDMKGMDMSGMGH